MPCFAGISEIMVELLFMCQLDKLYHNLASCDYLLVVEIVVKGKFLLLSFFPPFQSLGIVTRMCAIFIIGLIHVHALYSGKRALKHRKVCTR